MFHVLCLSLLQVSERGYLHFERALSFPAGEGDYSGEGS